VARGRGAVYAAAIEYDEREGCAALGGVTALGSPRCLEVNNGLCEERAVRE
jgi:hypothetical protein